MATAVACPALQDMDQPFPPADTLLAASRPAPLKLGTAHDPPPETRVWPWTQDAVAFAPAELTWTRLITGLGPAGPVGPGGPDKPASPKLPVRPGGPAQSRRLQKPSPSRSSAGSHWLLAFRSQQKPPIVTGTDCEPRGVAQVGVALAMVAVADVPLMVQVTPPVCPNWTARTIPSLN